MSWTKHWIGLARAHKSLGDKPVGAPAKDRTGGNPIPTETVAKIKRDLQTMTRVEVAALYGVSLFSVKNFAIGRTRRDVAPAPADAAFSTADQG